MCYNYICYNTNIKTNNLFVKFYFSMLLIFRGLLKPLFSIFLYFFFVIIIIKNINIMQSGPSKEELSNYFKNSRQYFNELAQHYKENDPAYYKEFIEPFYRNPFYSGSSTAQKGCGLRIVFLSFSVLLIAGIALVVYFLIQTNQDTDSDGFRFKENKIDTGNSDEIRIENLDSVILKKDFNNKDLEEIIKKKDKLEKDLNKKNKDRKKSK